mgnify:CR=1 FL=1
MAIKISGTTVIDDSKVLYTNVINPISAGGVGIGTTVSINGVPYPSDGTFSGFRNKIINGHMEFDNRDLGPYTATSAGGYTLDRWVQAENTDGTATVQQSTTAPAGFGQSLLWTTGTADTSLASTQGALIAQYIEGRNIIDLSWGTASAKAVTLSFWVRSSLTGTFGGSVKNKAAGTRSYPFSYVINSANTWEYKTITIPGDTTGSWSTDTSTGMVLILSLGYGSSFQGTANTWAGADYVTTSGCVNVMGTAGATFYVTGVQLEMGTVATPFEWRNRAQELYLCRRYFGVYIGYIVGSTGYLSPGPTYNYAVLGSVINYGQIMRATPGITTVTEASFNVGRVTTAPTARECFYYATGTALNWGYIDQIYFIDAELIGT